MYQPVSSQIDFPALERELLDDWQRAGIFEKSLRLSQRELVFYDGPPFPTGAPHFGTIFVSILKDVLARYFTMAGFAVPRRWGWDCHGLPIENAVEKKLGIKDKTDIEKKLGVPAFNRECRQLVSECNSGWESYIRKVGRWVDYRNAYRTLDRSYMESVLWVFKQCYEKGLIYKDYRVTPYCYHCETALSISDTRESDSTRPRQDPEVIVKFKAVEDIAGKPTYYLAWTTTPWTLFSNLVLAVGEDYRYVALEHDGMVFIMAEALLPKWPGLFGEKPAILKSFAGRELVGRRYLPLFPHFKELAGQGYFRILPAKFVTLDDGVGIVHCAPAFGEDDYWLCKRHGLGVKNPVDARGCFTAEIPEYVGRNVHDCNKDIIRRLKEEGVLLLHRTMVHNYPHCWRCRTPLIYRAMDAWYFAVEKIKDRLLARNEDIHWVPEHVKHGRFGKWLDGARDWNISRSRYWGTPIPVWECEKPGCGRRRVIGSVAELTEASGRDLPDLHKEFLDEITLTCPACGGRMRRVPEVLDCWFESGSMPFGQCHYPFENKEWFEAHFPADFIVEYPGQIRGWFYYLHVLAVAILDRASFKNCLVHGTLLAEDGSKISKSKKNFTDPMELIDHFGADALRLYLLNSSAVVMDDLNFKDAGVRDQIKQVLLPLMNSYSFFATYANLDGFKGDPSAIPQSSNSLDRWIMAVLFQTEKKVTIAYQSFYLNHSLGPMVEFIEALTNWYIRQSRARFWGGGLTEDKRQAYATLYYVLITVAKLLAPSAPFVSDWIYCQLTGAESVHLVAWPVVPESCRDDALIEENRLARTVVSLGLALRQQAGLRVRQPLPAIHVALPPSVSRSLLDAQIPVIRNELNVKAVTAIDDPTQLATLRVIPNARILGPKIGRDVQTVIKAAKAGQVREAGGQVVVFDGDREWKLDRQDVTLTYQGKAGADVMCDQGILVALDKTITPELREEGVANEINRIIQDMRKKAGYVVSDRIMLQLDGELSSDWKEHLARLALAELVPVTSAEADAVAEETIEKRTFNVRIKKCAQ